jgi:hypothetical protein
MGKDKKIIWIPKEYHKQLEKLGFQDKQLRISFDDEF